MMPTTFQGPLERVDECCWRIPRSYKSGMRVDGLIFADDEMIERVRADQAREVFEQVFGRPWEKLGLELVYDVAHNIAKFEEHTIDGVRKRVWVHRKGATRAFPPGHAEIPEAFRQIGQPVFVR